MKSSLPVAGSVAAKATSLTALWTFPSVLASAFLVAWGAEAAQFLVSQGLALAILAWLQTLPEFAVEAVIAWEAGKDPAKVHLAIANFTGSIRLLVGLGWPLVYFVAAFFARRTGRRKTWIAITFDDEHAIEIVGLLPPLLWFTVIWWKGTLGLLDAAVLTACYAAYLAALFRVPPREGDVEEMEDLPAVSRWALAQGPRGRGWAIAGIFLVGGALLARVGPRVRGVHARARHLRGSLPVRLRPVGRAVPLRVSRRSSRRSTGRARSRRRRWR